MHIVIGFLAALLVFSLIRYGLNSTPQQRKKLVYWAALGLAATVLLLLLLTGRIHYIAAIAAALLPFIKKLPALIRYLPLFNHLKKTVQASRGAGPINGRQSSVTTSMLNMTLDHDTGEMFGEVLDGSFKGFKLSAMNQSQLFQLHQEAVRQYPDSIAVLEAFFDRNLTKDWRQQAEAFSSEDRQGSQYSTSEMSPEQARQILGLAEGASKEDVQDAHRRLMQKLHPDRGGSNFLAAQVNLAKDILLNDLHA